MLARLTLVMFFGLVAVAPAQPVDPPAQGKLRNADYRGKLRGDQKGEVAIKLIRGETRVLFEARSVPFHCEVGERDRENFLPVRARLRANGTFDIDRYTLSGGGFAPATERFYRVHGQLLPDGRARGFVLYFDSSFGDTPTVAGDHCTTGGKWPWMAARR